MDFLFVILLMVVPLVFKAVEKQISRGTQNNAGTSAQDNGSIFTDSGEETRAPETMEEILATFFPKKDVLVKNVPENDGLDRVELENEEPIRIPVTDNNVRINVHDVHNVHKQGGKVYSGDTATVCNALGEDSEKKSEREKIDARKLIIYSEIMKPKF